MAWDPVLSTGVSLSESGALSPLLTGSHRNRVRASGG